MNTTTFTIESVHGVKQTFVLGPDGKAASGQPESNERPAPSDHPSGNKEASDAVKAPPR